MEVASKVYFIEYKASLSYTLLQKFEDLFKRAGFSKLVKENELVACKLHFGERGNVTFVRPIFIHKLAELIRANHALPFLTDTSTLYVGSRSNAPEHLEVAREHGFSGAPSIIADGLRGESSVSVKIEGKYFKELKIASGIYYADAMIVVSHFKGHLVTGFGGALKNLGMGCSAKQGKLDMHSGLSPQVSEECNGCGSCLKWCSANAIEIKKQAKIIESKCIGCGSCIGVCPVGAVKIRWQDEPVSLQEKMVEYAKGGISGFRVEGSGYRVGYINFLTEITKLCDCAPTTEVVAPDIGILASSDPVAIDRASFDLVNKASGGKFSKIWPDVNPGIQLKYAEQLGLGTQEYEVLKI